MRRLPRLQYLVWKIDKTRGQFPTYQALSVSSPAPSNACEQPPRVCTVPTYSGMWSRSQAPSVGCAGHSSSEEGRHPNRRARLHSMVAAPGYRAVTTHVLVDDNPNLGSDAVLRALT